MGCATSLVKYIVFLFNLAFVLLAIAFIAVGVVVKLDIGEITDHVEKQDVNLAAAPILLIVIGCLIFVVAFLGCCGAVRESSCMLTTYAIILLILFIVQIALGVYAFLLFKDSDTDIKQDIKKELLEVLGKYKDNEDVRKVIDTWQEEKECCGVDGPGDWFTVWGNLDVPKTCCANQNICTPLNAYKDGCFDAFYDFLQTSVRIIGILFVVIAGIELAGIAFIAIGVIFKLDIEDFTAALNKTEINFALAPTLLIIVGSIVFIISFFGCCGAVRESTCMLTTYAIILLTLFLLQVALGVYAFIQFKDSDAHIKDEIHDELKKTLGLYDKDNVARETIDSLQSERECCGVDSPADWRQIWNNDSLPSSCCRNLPPQCRASDGDSYRKGCFDPLYNFLQETIKIVGIIVVVIGATEIIGAIIALCLSSSIRNHERRGNYA